MGVVIVKMEKVTTITLYLQHEMQFIFFDLASNIYAKILQKDHLKNFLITILKRDYFIKKTIR